MENGSLQVYRASAGSGKTFRITMEYIKLLMQNPLAFMNTLAVTFTNKATEEMKTRILGTLYSIAHGGGSIAMKVLTEETGLDEKVIREKSAQALDQLVRRYGYFHVETIDTFFQTVLRNLARELGLTPNLRVDLRDKDIENEAVDLMIERLKADDEVLVWITDFINENIKDDKGWNVISGIKAFSQNLFKEEYSSQKEEFEDKTGDAGFFDKFKQKLYAIRNSSRNELNAIVSDFDQLLNDIGIGRDELSYAKGFFTNIEKKDYKHNSGKNVEKALKAENDDDIVSAWLTKNTLKTHPDYEKLVLEKLNPFLIKAEQRRAKAAHDFFSAEVTLKHLNQLRLLHRVERVVREENAIHNRFLLSETQPLLNKMIGESDAPFIYEKMGTRIDNIMIDEFQDTSMMQWKNFRVLLDECISRLVPGQRGNMIVGDVKQSIYRWRSGDWRLLNNIQSEVKGATLATPPLDTNRRSAENIVRFNNAFFSEAVRYETAELSEEYAGEVEAYERAYEDCIQKTGPHHKGKNDGYVEIDFVDSDDYRGQILEKTYEIICELLSRGVAPRDIAVLARRKRDLQDVANYCLEKDPDMTMISDESFRLDSSDAVNIIVGAMAVISGNTDKLTIAELVAAYRNTQKLDKIVFHENDDYEQYLPKEFVEQKVGIAMMPLHDMAEEIVRIFGIDKLESQTAYVCTFFDMLDSFTSDHSPSVTDLVDYWNETMREKTIHSDNAEGIQLMTIHKSKGLERDNIIVPFCDWKLEQVSTLWSRAKEDPYAQLPIIPIDFSSQLLESTYSDEYHNEHLMNMVDNMNMLYVAFTRARLNLFAIMKRGTKTYRSNTIETTLMKLSDNTPEEWNEANPQFVLDHDSKIERFILGGLTIKPREIQKTTADDVENIFTEKPLPLSTSIRAFRQKGSFLQSTKSNEYISSPTDSDKKSHVDEGILLHDIFSHINTSADVENAVEGLIFEGRLGRDKAKSIAKMIKQRVDDEKVREWFDGSWTLYNECNIIVSPDKTKTRNRRPDRVMTRGEEAVVVDFKFASNKYEKDYKLQVSEYMSYLRDLGYKQVEGYIWYVYRNEVVSI